MSNLRSFSILYRNYVLFFYILFYNYRIAKSRTMRTGRNTKTSHLTTPTGLLTAPTITLLHRNRYGAKYYPHYTARIPIHTLNIEIFQTRSRLWNKNHWLPTLGLGFRFLYRILDNFFLIKQFCARCHRFLGRRNVVVFHLLYYKTTYLYKNVICSNKSYYLFSVALTYF